MINSKISYIWYRARRRLLSKQSWAVLHQRIDMSITVPLNERYTVRRAKEGDQQHILNVLPEELVGHLPDQHSNSLVYDRFRANVPCFVAQNSAGDIVGGCWCPMINDAQLLSSLKIDSRPAFEITTLFVCPSYRGSGVASVVLNHVFKSMKEDCYVNCLSLVWYTRPASIKAHIKSGFRPIGEKNTYSVAGLRWTRYNFRNRIDNI